MSFDQNVIVYKWAIRELAQHNAALAFYVKLAAIYGSAEIRDTQQGIADKTGLHLTTVKEHLNLMLSKGILQKEWVRNRGSNTDARKSFRFMTAKPQ